MASVCDTQTGVIETLASVLDTLADVIETLTSLCDNLARVIEKMAVSIENIARHIANTLMHIESLPRRIDRLGWRVSLTDGLPVRKHIFGAPASQHEQCWCKGQSVCTCGPKQGGEVFVLFAPGTEVIKERTVWHPVRVRFMKCAIHRHPSDSRGQHSNDNGLLKCAHGLRLTLDLRGAGQSA
jgi:hypothetical protein